MHTDAATTGAYCLYPARPGDEVDVTERLEGDSLRYVVRNRATSRYFLLKGPEYQIFQRIDGSSGIREIASPANGAGPKASTDAVVRFLSKLDSFGLLAREGDFDAARATPGHYFRIKLFNPDAFLAFLDRRLGWALTRTSITASFVIMGLVAVGMLIRASEAAAYTGYIYSEYGLSTIILFTLVITTVHEMAHGLACKHFGGDVPEVGVLMIYYVVPAFYCNVSDIYRFGKRSQRVWVVMAGIYWQLLVSAIGALVWLLATPQTVLADFCFLVFLGGTFNVIINCNPLIRLDGYYALSQLFGVHNLQKRSADYVRRLMDRLMNRPGLPIEEKQGNALYIVYWLLSIAYSIALIWIILTEAGAFLMDYLGFVGILLTVAIAALVGQRFSRPVTVAAGRGLSRAAKVASSSAGQWASGIGEYIRGGARGGDGADGARITEEGALSTGAKGASNMSAQASLGTEAAPSRAFAKPTRRRLVKAGIVVVILGALLAPWQASAGSDCTLLLPPGRETAARANVDAVLAELYVQPGDMVNEGAKIARLSNPEMEDRLTELNAQIKTLDTRDSEIEEELRVRSEELLSANFKQRDHERLTGELKAEAAQISKASGSEADSAPLAAGMLPPGLAVLQSDVELKQVQLEYDRKEVTRYKKLFEEGLVGEIQYDAAVNAVTTTEKELQTARARLQAALVDHRRLVDSTETGALVAQTEARAARSNFEALISEMHSNREQVESIRERRDILQREYDGMNVVAPRSGVILGEDLQKMIGSHYSKGQEICRVGDLERFLLKIDVSERDISKVTLDSPVRFKLKTVPGRTFTGQVSKIRAESTPNQYGQRVYPVEVLVENGDRLLRPGMTGFARINFGRQSIGVILAQKVWQALRPEMWLF
jgi:putative peptide zinc metalloprotease protein